MDAWKFKYLKWQLNQMSDELKVQRPKWLGVDGNRKHELFLLKIVETLGIDPVQISDDAWDKACVLVGAENITNRHRSN